MFRKNQQFSDARTISMHRKLMEIMGAGLAAIAIGMWLSSHGNSTTEIPSATTPSASAAISIFEIHNLAHLEFLPVQQMEDQSFVFFEARR
jgi:shikimate 5-dehydrogenase